MAEASNGAHLFGQVPADLFRVFTGRSRFLFADLLAYLADDLFGQTGDIATKRRVLESISEFMDRLGRARVADALDDMTVGPSDVAVYARLKDTGWLVEYRDRYRRVVDFDPSARLLLQTLLDIRNGRVRSYGGAVLNVLTLLESVVKDPLDRAINVREAALSARGFMNHLRTVAGAMRRVEDVVMRQPSAGALVRSFVADFIEATIVQDYRNLHTRDSPFRFRGRIIETGELLLADDERLDQVAEGWMLGGIARDAETAMPAIIDDLRQIVRVFTSVDDHVSDIETTTYRIERRMTNIVRFTDRLASIGTERLLAAVAELGRSGLGENDEVGVTPRLLTEAPMLASQHLYMPPRQRRQVEERVVEVRPPDPALTRYLAALDLFEARVTIGPERIERYLASALEAGTEIRAADLEVRGLDDFLVVERLHEIAVGPLAEHYDFEEGEGTVTNDWLERRDFTITRRETAHG